MEPFIEDSINNPKVPKWLGFVIMAVVCGLLIFLGVLLAINSSELVGRIFGGIIVRTFCRFGGILICKNSKMQAE